MQLFTATRPLHALNALEARYAYDVPRHSALFVFLTFEADSHNAEQLRAVVDAQHWADIVEVHVDTHADEPESIRAHLARLMGQRRAARELERIASRFGPFSAAFIPNSPLCRHLARAGSAERVVLFDDGFATLTQAQRGLFRGKRSVDLAWHLRRAKRVLRNGLTGTYPIRLEKDHSLFTCFELPASLAPRVRKNTYNFLRDQAGELEQTNETWILGSPAFLFSSYDSYREQVEHALVYLGCERGVYIPHRLEPKADLERLASDLPLEVRKLATPVEHHLACIGPRPRQLASFFSTGIHNCALVLGSSCHLYSFRVPERALQPSRRSAVERVYRYYEQHLEDTVEVVAAAAP